MSARVYHRHIAALRYCARGSRAWFARHGLDWPAFLRDGIDADRLTATGDAMALRAVARAEQEVERGR